MKRFIAIILAILIIMSFAACGQKKEEAAGGSGTTETTETTGTTGTEGSEEGLPEKRDVTDKVVFADYSFKLNGNDVTNADLDGVSIYKIEVTVTNKKGEESTYTYCGYVLLDVLAKLGIDSLDNGITVVTSDGEEVICDTLTALDDYTLLAIERDKEVGEGGTFWIAPCKSGSSSDYIKLGTEIRTE